MREDIEADAEQQTNSTEPSQITGQLKNAQGQLYTAVSSLLPESANPESWAQSGELLQKQGTEEVQAAKNQAVVDSTISSAKAKFDSVVGAVTGDQERLDKGNLEAEKASWKYKQASSDKVLDVPVPSLDAVKGKAESVMGSITGDQVRQIHGNRKAEEAAWRDGN